jgi:hypothetical protein
LSTDAIAALVEAAREGRLPEEASAPQRRRRMRAVDFTRPTKFTADQERRLKRSLEAFCRSPTRDLAGSPPHMGDDWEASCATTMIRESRGARGAACFD